MRSKLEWLLRAALFLALLAGTDADGQTATKTGDPQPLKEGATSPEVQKALAGVTSMEDFLARLPKSVRQNYVIMTDSESAQPSKGKDECAPSARFILQSPDSKEIWSFSTAKDERGEYLSQTVERIRFDEKTKSFEFSEIDFSGTRPKLSVNPASCRTCHGDPPRPNWDAYDNWAGMLPFNRDRVYEASHEAKTFRQVLEAMATDPRAKHLPPPKGVTVTTKKSGIDVAIEFDRTDKTVRHRLTDGREFDRGGKFFLMSHPDKSGDEGQGVALFDNLTDLNARRIAEELRGHPAYPKLKYALAGAVKACFKTEAEAEAFFPPEVIKAKRKGLADLETDTEKARKTLPAMKAKLLRQSLRTMIACNLKREGKTAGGAELDLLVEAELRRRSSNALDETKQLVDREIYGTTSASIARLRYVLEPEVSIVNWSMGVMSRKKTLTFADLFDVYRTRLRTLIADDKDLDGKTCEQLAKASLAAYPSSTPAKKMPPAEDTPLPPAQSPGSHSSRWIAEPPYRLAGAPASRSAVSIATLASAVAYSKSTFSERSVDWW